MEELIKGPLAESLEKGRDGFNARFAYYRRLNRKINPKEFGDVIRFRLDPIVRAVAEADRSAVEKTVEDLYGLALELMGHDCLGAGPRYYQVDLAWQKLLPKAAYLLIQSPLLLASSISNAAFNLSRETRGGAEKWIESMISIIPLCRKVDEYLSAGQVFSWQCGLSHYRNAALDVWKSLPDDLAYTTLGMKVTANKPPRIELESKLADPWFNPANMSISKPPRIRIVKQVGGFRGFGGLFMRPPKVFQAEGRLYVSDGDKCWSLYADCFGAALKGCDQTVMQSGDQGSGFKLDSSGNVNNGRATANFNAFRECTSYASTEYTLAVTLPRSHKVFLAAMT